MNWYVNRKRVKKQGPLKNTKKTGGEKELTKNGASHANMDWDSISRWS